MNYYTVNSCISQWLESNDLSLLRLCGLCFDITMEGTSADCWCAWMCPTIVVCTTGNAIFNPQPITLMGLMPVATNCVKGGGWITLRQFCPILTFDLCTFWLDCYNSELLVRNRVDASLSIFCIVCWIAFFLIWPFGLDLTNTIFSGS